METVTWRSGETWENTFQTLLRQGWLCCGNQSCSISCGLHAGCGRKEIIYESSAFHQVCLKRPDICPRICPMTVKGNWDSEDTWEANLRSRTPCYVSFQWKWPLVSGQIMSLPVNTPPLWSLTWRNSKNLDGDRVDSSADTVSTFTF